MLKKIFFLLLVPAILYGCGAPPLPDLYWPSPPDPPKIKFVKFIRGGSDFKKSSLAVDIALGAQGSFMLRKPMGVHIGSDQKIYVTDTAASDVFVYDPPNSDAKSLGSMGARGIFKPIAVSTDSQGRIFVTDSQMDTVTVYSSTGQNINQLKADPPFKQPSGIFVDEPHNKVYVTDTHNHHIVVFALDTLEQIQIIGKRGSEEGELNFPSHIAVDGKGKLYVVDTMNGRVQIFDSEGRFLRAFGQFGDVPGMFARPKGIAVDSEGHIYVVDAAFNNVQIFDQEGRILLSFASYGADRGQMVLPAGMAADGEDYLYVVDSWNRRVHVYEYLGEKYKAREGVTEIKRATSN